jgi:tRNA(Ile2) C34 agmatinyltransferase TiaS
MECGNCGVTKKDDGFRACEKCRETWRKQQRKPGGYKHQIEMLTEEIARLKAEICVLRRAD